MMSCYTWLLSNTAFHRNTISYGESPDPPRFLSSCTPPPIIIWWKVWSARLVRQSSSLAQGTPHCMHHALWWCVSGTCARPDCVRAHCIAKSSVYIVLPLFCLSTQTYSLAALNATVNCMWVAASSHACMVIHTVCTNPLQLYRGISLLVPFY